ncbi:hypothetical protein [Rheinheimera sp.]|uniref:hypothetical protein n=1 Tax=Rheinheimera sp. TaxID=1869214 RepID=UPI00307E5EAA
MSLTLAAGIASLAVDYGPSVIRSISSLFGGSKTADKVADIVETVGNLTLKPQDKVAAVAERIAALPPAEFVELERLKVELEKEQTRRLELQNQRHQQNLSDQQASHAETQTTIRAGDVATDEYVRRTRPLMARQSFYAGSVYVLLMAVMEAFGKGVGPDWYIAMTVYTPALGYLGLRTLDGFAPFGKGSKDKPGRR